MSCLRVPGTRVLIERPASLRFRLLATVGVLLLLGVIVAGVALDALFGELAMRGRRDVLDAQVVALISSAELRSDGSLAAHDFREARLATPGSGLYAEIRAADGSVSWRSPSSIGAAFSLAARPAVGERQFEIVTLADGSPALALTLGVSWETAPGTPRRFAVSAVESLVPYFAERVRMRAALAAGALLLAGMLFGGLALALRFGLRPLARIEREIAEIEGGSRELLGGRFPRELAGVASNLNALLATERQRLERYRTTLDNLAHSLKTPLSALSSLLQGAAPDRRELEAQVTRMQDIVQHQLRRAVSGGAAPTLAGTLVEPVIRELVGALAKVYRDRALRIEVAIPASVAYPIDRGDLMELAGNLLDNGCKFGRRFVRVTAAAVEDPRWRRPGLELVVEDDGPGVPVADRDRVLERGMRADERVPGQGIGLAVAHEIVAALGGSMDLVESTIGGARVIVRLPGR